MLVKMMIRLSALSLGLSYVACTTPQQQSQLATLHERMNQMISALYSSPLLSKVQASTTSSEDPPSPSQESTYGYPAPQVVFVAPPSFLEAGVQPSDYGYPATNHPIPRATWPYPYDYSNYQPQIPPPVYSPYPKPYPEYPRSAYPPAQAPQTVSLPLAFSSPMPYPSPYSSPMYNSPPFPFPVFQPGFSLAPPAPAPYPSQISYPPPSYPAPVSYSSGFFPPSYLASVPALFPSPLPPQFSTPIPYPSSVPHLYPQSISMPYSSFPFPQPMYPPSAFSKLSDKLPQSQYEY